MLIASKTDDLIQEFVAAGGDWRDWRPGYSIAPTNTEPIIVAQNLNGEVIRSVEPAIWDFPRSAYSNVRGPLINARRDNLTTTWAGALAGSRCIVPMTGYFEWTGPKTDKQPHFIHGPADGDGYVTLAAAGLYAQVEGESKRRFVIITDEGRDASGELHDRMPIFLTPDLWADWLDPESLTAPNRQAAVVGERKEREEHLLAAIELNGIAVSPIIETHTVDKRVNSVTKIDRADPTLIVPLHDEGPGTLF